MENTPQPAAGFAFTGLSPALLSIVTKAGFTTPTPIQEKAIPVALTGVDLVGIAQTGTGKTLAFSLPIIENLSHNNKKAVVIVPTRELALQVEESVRKITRFVNPGIRTVCLIGGMPIYRQIQDLKMNPRIIIATPGRLQDHLNQATVRLEDTAILVLDEADRMLDMGFAPQINRILTSIPTTRQTMLFSATMEPAVARIAAEYMQNPVRIEVAKPGSNNIQIKQELCYVSSTMKSAVLEKLLSQHPGPILVFSRTKHGAKKLTGHVQKMGHTAAEIHSNKSLSQRRQALDGFKSGRYRVLVATDVAARGIDVRDIAVVVNYDLPDAAEDYVHRIGRTGRAGKSGLAVSLATPDQHRDVRNIERLMNTTLALSEHSDAPQYNTPPAPREFRQRPGSSFAPSARSPFNGPRRAKSNRPYRGAAKSWSR